MTRICTIVGVVSLGSLLIVGCVGAGDGSDGPQLYVEVHPNSKCVVLGTSMPCADVPSYLKSSLKTPFHTYIAVAAASSESATLAAMSPVIENLKFSGYELVIGSIDVRELETNSK